MHTLSLREGEAFVIWLKIRVALSAAVEAMFVYIYICVIKSSKKRKNCCLSI
jgi:hypothetical protein